MARPSPHHSSFRGIARASKVTAFLIAFLVAAPRETEAQVSGPIYRGVDLSYVNEMEDCGGIYRMDGQPVDPFDLFAQRGANLVRVRLWHNPSWTGYSTFDDVRRTIGRVKGSGLETLLDFHYSDDWADPSSQSIPAAWQGLPFDVVTDSLYAYTFDVITRLATDGLAPEMVQIGNEINPGMLLPHGSKSNWAQLGTLLNAAIRAVRDAESASGLSIKIALHIAQPENVQSWIADAINRGRVHDFEVIGLSYYRAWSSAPLHHLPDYIARLNTAFNREVVVLETGYPWTFSAADGANNILGVEALQLGYPATADGQRRYVRDLVQAVLDGGGSGIVYWEPAWISTACSTRWGQGSHWENATFFDFDNGNEVLPAIDFLSGMYATDRTVPVELQVDAGGHDVSRGMFVAGDMTLDSTGTWQTVSMEYVGGDIYRASFDLRANTAYRLNFYNGPNVGQDQESLSFRCAGSRGDHRLISISETSAEFAFVFATCEPQDLVDVTLQVDMAGQSASGGVFVAGDLTRNASDQWSFRPMQNVGGNIFAASFSLVRGGRYPFAFYTGTSWAPGEKESIPHPCAPAWGTHRMLEVPEDPQAIRYRFGNCLVTDATDVDPLRPPQPSAGLLPHYPNPADGPMTFVYELSEAVSVRLSVFDLLGREVAVIDEGRRLPARHEIAYDVRSLPAGVYFYRLIAGTNSDGRSIIVF